VAEIVARGEAELGFQQISELKPVASIDVVGPFAGRLAEGDGIFRRHRQRVEEP
jgi:molybdate transport system substrate-binding protein